MYFCYVDESGHCGEAFDVNQPTEVLVGVVSDASKVHKTKREHRTFLSQLLDELGVDISELKASEVFAGRKEWRTVNPTKRQEVFVKLLKWVRERSCKLIVCPVDSKKFFDLKAKEHELAIRLHSPYVAGGFNILLALQRDKYGTKNNKGKTVVIFDEQSGLDKRLLSLIGEDLRYTDKYTKIKLPRRNSDRVERLCQIIDIPFFSKSESSELIQIADVVAFVVARYIQLYSFDFVEKFDGERTLITEFYKGIKPALINAANINPNIKGDPLANFYLEIRPRQWTPQKWEISQE